MASMIQISFCVTEPSRLPALCSLEGLSNSDPSPSSSLSLFLYRSVLMSSSRRSSGRSARSAPTPPLPSTLTGSSDMEGIDPFLETPLVYCGGEEADQDVTILVVEPGLPETEYLPTLAELRVHSSRLLNCSKLLAMSLLLSPTTSKRKRTPLEFKLEALADVTVYSDCFRRMYTPFQKSFEDVSYALDLLSVANQIEFEELSRSICRYLSSVHWSDEEELRIRRYVASPSFPRHQAKELLARVERKEARRKSIRLLIQQCVHSLRNVDNHSSRVFLEELLKAAQGQQSEYSTFEQGLVTIVNQEAKRLIEDVHDSYVESVRVEVPKLRAVCSVLELLVRASLGDVAVKCFLRLEKYPNILAHAARSLEWGIFAVANEFAGLILSICAEVVVGNLLLGIPDRVALLTNWCPLFEELEMMESLKRMSASLFATLPFDQQMEVLNNEAKEDRYDTCVSAQSLVKLLKDHWVAADEARMQTETE